VYQIEVVSDEELVADVPTALLAAAARATLIHQDSPPGELTILVTTDEMMAALNQTHRGVREPTDVLAFPGGTHPAPPGFPRYLGDIAISLPRAQAAAGAHSLEAELQLLSVHATLHLLGHDHAGDDAKARMWVAQREILSILGVSVSVDE
jgi:rRNA maturation RNase YbeY